MTNLINTCLAGAGPLRTIASYSHLLPAGILLAMSIYILSKDRKTLNFSFFVFVGYLCLWLVGDWITWFTDNYFLVNVFWAFLDYTDVCMFIGALYFYVVFITGQDLSLRQKTILASLTLFPLVLTLSGNSILGFDHTQCESVEDVYLTYYRLCIEVGTIIAIGVISWIEWKRKMVVVNKRSLIIVTASIIAFLGTFSLAGYLSSVTYVYEIQLYGLFVLPVFIMFIVFAINRYDIFELKYFNQQLLAWILVPLVASEYFFLEGWSDSILNTITLLISGFIVFVLGRSIKKENIYKNKIEALNTDLIELNKHLKEANEQKTEFISLASHQLRGPLTAIKGYASMILEGDFGALPDALRLALETIFKSTQSLVVLVGDYLDVSRMDQGKMKYDFTDFDLRELAKEVVLELQPNIRISGLELNSSVDDTSDLFIHGDRGKIKQVISNLIDNSIKYTPKGVINLIIERTPNDKIIVSIKDTGVGIEHDVLPKLFERFTRAPDASRTNISGTGLGLYVAKKMLEAHRGRIWAESEGKNKGSTFKLELDVLHRTPTEINKKLEAKIAEVNKELDKEI